MATYNTQQNPNYDDAYSGYSPYPVPPPQQSPTQQYQQRPPPLQQREQQQQQQPYNHRQETAYPPPPSPNNYPFLSPDASHGSKPFARGSEDDNGGRDLTRTPSPTPSELKELTTGAIDWKTLMNWRFWIRKEWIWYYVALIIILVVVSLISIFHTQIVHWLTPVTQWMQRIKYGWLIPIGILFVISFPPLFGHEIVAMLCGLVWGLRDGFFIVAAGTLLGEIGNFYAFKYCCKARNDHAEKTKIWYACLARVVREGGFLVAVAARLSAIPGHFTTAIFATCGMNIFVFIAAAILSLPKQFITVYLGVILEQSSDGSKETSKSKIISDSVLAASFLITGVSMWYILHKMNQAKPAVIYARRKARQGKMQRASTLNPGMGPYGTSTSSVTFAASETEIPLTTSMKNGGGYQYPGSNQAGYRTANVVFAPQPQRPGYHVMNQQQNQYGFSKEDDNRSDESADSTTTLQALNPNKEGRGRGLTPQQPSYSSAYSAPRRIDSEEVGWDAGEYYQNGTPNRSPNRTPPGIEPPRRMTSPQRVESPTRGGRQPVQVGYMQNQSPTQRYHQRSPPPGPDGQGMPAIRLQPPSDSTTRSGPVHVPGTPREEVMMSPPLPTPEYSNGFAQQQQQHARSPPQQYAAPSHPPPQQQYAPPLSSNEPPHGFHHGEEPSEATFGHGHSLEATGMSYHTAVGSEDSMMSQETKEVPGGWGRY